MRFTRDWVREQRLPHFIDGEGICHLVLPEHGHVLPGRFIVGGDSHSPTGGAFGAYMFGIGATEMASVLATGEIWLRVPHTIRVHWSGRLGDGVCAKDMMLFLCARFGLGGGRYETVEYAGPAVAALPMQERMTLANMSAELGAQTGYSGPDRTTLDWLAAAGVDAGALAGIDLAHWRSDDEAPLLASHVFDAAALAPHVAAPTRRPTACRWHRPRAKRCRSPTWPVPAPAGRPAHGGARAARAPRGRRHQPAGGAGIAARPAPGRGRGHAGRAAGCRRDPAGQQLQCLRRLRALALPRRQPRHRVDGAQFRRPHGRRRQRGLAGLADDRGGQCRHRPYHRSPLLLA